MNPFTPNERIKSYACPVLKICVCLAALLLIIFRKSIFPDPGKVISALVTVSCTAMGVISIYCINISLYEIGLVRESKRRKVKSPPSNATKAYKAAEILSLIQQCDIIEIELLKDGEKIKIGASAETRNASSQLVNKKYFYGDKELSSLEELKTLLSPQGQEIVEVAAIDGCPPK